MNRKEAIILMKEHIKTDNLRSHSLAVAAIMEGLAQKLEQNPEKWFITGILHDLDFEYTKDEPKKHGFISMDLLKNTDLSDDQRDAILSHTGNSNIVTLLDKALWASDPLSGLVIAAALMNPAKKVSVLKLKSLKKKFKSKNFAAGANRIQIASCKNFGMDLDNFLQLSIDSMSKYEKDLGFD